MRFQKDDLVYVLGNKDKTFRVGYINNWTNARDDEVTYDLVEVDTSNEIQYVPAEYMELLPKPFVPVPGMIVRIHRELTGPGTYWVNGDGKLLYISVLGKDFDSVSDDVQALSAKYNNVGIKSENVTVLYDPRSKSV
jgi:hypothetical protein